MTAAPTKATGSDPLSCISPGPCPACGQVGRAHGPELRLAGLSRLVSMRCIPCGHRWLPLSEQQLETVEANYHHDYSGFRADRHLEAALRKELETRLLPLVPAGSRALDVGCGNGTFLRQATRAGYDAEGIDVSEAAVELCREQRLRAARGDFLARGFDSSFSIITMWDVVEHLTEPLAFARRAHSLLTERGLLVLKIPSPGELNFRLLRWFPGRAGAWLGAPAHLQFFTEHSLTRMLVRAGFRQLLWFPSLRLRNSPLTFNPKRLIGRQINQVTGRLARNQNLYVFAAKQPLLGQAVALVRPRRLDVLESRLTEGFA